MDEPAARRARLLVIGDDGDPEDPSLGERSGAQIQLDEVAARRAAAELHRLARELGLRSSSVEFRAGRRSRGSPRLPRSASSRPPTWRSGSVSTRVRAAPVSCPIERGAT